MKIFLSFLLLLTAFTSVHAANSDTNDTHQERSVEPNFTPPKEKEGPVFPIEELIPKPTEQDNKFFAEMLNMLATLGLIIGLILIVAWFLKRFVNTRLEQANLSSVVKVMERRSLSQKSSLYLLQVENRAILIAESPAGITKLSEFEMEEEEENPSNSTKELPSAFSKILEKKEKPIK